MGYEITKALIDEIEPIVSQTVRHTPVERSHYLSKNTNKEIYIKLENLQITGSFKVRGALAKISSLSPEEKKRGIISCSAGNHGAGVGLACHKLGVKGTVYVPRTAPKVKCDIMKAYGVEVIKTEFNTFDASQRVATLEAKKRGLPFVHAYNDPYVIAGNGGTIAREILKDLSDLDCFIAPVGGGGLILGLAAVAKSQNLKMKIIGVQSEASPAMYRSLKENKAYTEIQSQTTFAEGLEGGISHETFHLGQQYIDEMVLVSEDDIKEGVRHIAANHQYMIEGSAAVGVSALIKNKIQTPFKKACLILTGRNIDLDTFKQIICNYTQ